MDTEIVLNNPKSIKKTNLFRVKPKKKKTLFHRKNLFLKEKYFLFL